MPSGKITLLTYHQKYFVAFISEPFYSECPSYYFVGWVWISYFRHFCHIPQGRVSLKKIFLPYFYLIFFTTYHENSYDLVSHFKYYRLLIGNIFEVFNTQRSFEENLPNFVVIILLIVGLAPQHAGASTGRVIILTHSILPISRGHFFANNSQKTAIARPWRRGMGIFHEYKVWSQFYLRINSILCSIVLIVPRYIEIL